MFDSCNVDINTRVQLPLSCVSTADRKASPRTRLPALSTAKGQMRPQIPLCELHQVRGEVRPSCEDSAPKTP